MKAIITYQDLVEEQKKTLDKLHKQFDCNGTTDDLTMLLIEDIVSIVETISEM